MNSPERFSITLEKNLKGLHDKMLYYYEKYSEAKNNNEEKAKKSSKYDNLLQLVDRLSTVFIEIMTMVDQKISNSSNWYYELEKVLQKYESEIRNHIRIEQQLKLYSESLQSKLDEYDKNKSDILITSKNKINNLKKENQKLTEELKQNKELNDGLINQIKTYEEMTRQFQEKLSIIPLLEDKIRQYEKNLEQHHQMNKMILSSQNKEVEYVKKVNLELDYNKSARSQSLGRGSHTANSHVISNTPVKLMHKPMPPNMPKTDSSLGNNEFLKVKIEITENNKTKVDMHKNKQAANPREFRYSSSKKSRDNTPTPTRSPYTNYPIILHNMSNASIVSLTDSGVNNGLQQKRGTIQSAGSKNNSRHLLDMDLSHSVNHNLSTNTEPGWTPKQHKKKMI